MVLNGEILSNIFLENVCNIIFEREVIHLSHITGKIIGYARKARENKNKVSITARNLFGFDLLFFFKGLRLGVWRTTNSSIDGSLLTNINFANIGEQIRFIDTIKYYQQSLSTLAASLTEEGK